jgi:hypothetical protein
MKENTYTRKLIVSKNCIYRFYTLHVLLVLISSFSYLQKTIAQSIGNWTFNGIVTGTAGLNNTVSIADFSASVPIHTFNGGTEYFGENGWPAGSINTSMYMQFSLTPLTGYQLDISTLVLSLRRSNTGSPAGSGPVSWSLRSSLDGFTSDIATGSMTHVYANYTVTPGSSFLNLYSTVTFRLYGYNTTVSSGGSSRFVIDNITVNGIGYLLPVKLGALQAVIQEEKVNLSYTVYNTEKTSRYFIERSADGIHYTSINNTEEMTAAAEKQYTYTDDIQLLNGISKLYYRLHMTGSSGTNTYSASVMVKRKNTPGQVKIYTGNNQLYINGTFATEGVYQATLYTMAGQALWHTTFTAAEGYNTFALPINRHISNACVIQLSNGKGYSKSVINPTP